MSTFVRYSAVVAVCLATGLFSSGCNLWKKGEEKEKPETPTEEPEEKGAEVNIFEDTGGGSAREASKEALGAITMEEPKTDVDLDTEKVDTPKVEEPKAEDIEI